MELTVEVSQNKWPATELLPGLFEANLPAMLAFPLAAAFSGLRSAPCFLPSAIVPEAAACRTRCAAAAQELILSTRVDIEWDDCLPVMMRDRMQGCMET